jgi:hypothetical protein
MGVSKVLRGCFGPGYVPTYGYHHSTDLRVSPAGGLVCGGCGRFLFLHVEAGGSVHPMAPLRACGALVCPDCRIHVPSPHRETCRAPRVRPCGSRWFWLSPCRAIKCVACAGPTDLSMVEGWVMARESEVPEEIFKLLTVETPAQEEVRYYFIF